LSVFFMFGRNKLSSHVESRLSVPIPASGGHGALAPEGRVKSPGKWRSRIAEQT